MNERFNKSNNLSYQKMIDIVELLSQICYRCNNDFIIRNNASFYSQWVFENFVTKKEFNDFINTILEITKDKKLPLDELSIGLFVIKDYFEEVKTIIKDNNIEQKLYNKLDDINSKLFDGDVLSDDDDTFFNLCLKNNIMPKSELNVATVFRNVLIENKIVSYETFKEVVKTFIKTCMQQVNNGRVDNYNPIVTINSLNPELKGGANYYSVTINDKLVESLYNGNCLAFTTIFHELRHIDQLISIKSGYLDEEVMYFIKDHVLRKIFNYENNYDYYIKNYDYISSEIDAEISGIITTINYLEKVIGLKIKERFTKELESKVNKKLEKKKDKHRKLNDGDEDINVLFDKKIKDYPLFLDEYPQLTVEYKVEYGIVRRKTKEELLDTLFEYQDSKGISSYIENILKTIDIDETYNTSRKK